MNASGRPNTCKSNGNGDLFTDLPTSGGWVSIAYVIFIVLRDSPGKLGLIPYSLIYTHVFINKDLSAQYEHASY